MLTPAATVAVRMLEALGVADAATARSALILWCRPSPRLAPADVREILATFDDPGDPRGTEEFTAEEMPPRHRPPGTNLDGESP